MELILIIAECFDDMNFGKLGKDSEKGRRSKKVGFPHHSAVCVQRWRGGNQGNSILDNGSMDTWGRELADQAEPRQTYQDGIKKCLFCHSFPNKQMGKTGIATVLFKRST